MFEVMGKDKKAHEKAYQTAEAIFRGAGAATTNIIMGVESLLEIMKNAKKDFAMGIDVSGNAIEDPKAEMVTFCEDILDAIQTDIGPNLKLLLTLVAKVFNKSLLN